jgi:hypothetical protein
MVLAVARWARRPGWGRDQRVALAAAYAGHSLLMPPGGNASSLLPLAGHLVFGLGAITLVVAGLRGPRHARKGSDQMDTPFAQLTPRRRACS